MSDHKDLVGKEFYSWRRTITEGDFTMMTLSTWTIVPTHTDAEYMKSSQFGGTILAGVCTIAAIAGLISATSGLTPFLEENGVKGVAILGYENIRFLAPVRTNDTIRAKVEIIEVVPTSNPKRFVLKERHTGYNQKDEVILDAVRNILMEEI